MTRKTNRPEAANPGAIESSLTRTSSTTLDGRSYADDAELETFAGARNLDPEAFITAGVVPMNDNHGGIWLRLGYSEHGHDRGARYLAPDGIIHGRRPAVPFLADNTHRHIDRHLFVVADELDAIAVLSVFGIDTAVIGIDPGRIGDMADVWLKPIAESGRDVTVIEPVDVDGFGDAIAAHVPQAVPVALRAPRRSMWTAAQAQPADAVTDALRAARRAVAMEVAA